MTYLIDAFRKLAKTLKSYIDAFWQYIINENLKQFMSLRGTFGTPENIQKSGICGHKRIKWYIIVEYSNILQTV